MRVAFKHFESSYSSWDSLFTAAAAFATEIGPDRLIGISHSASGQNLASTGVVTVWYWENNPEAQGGRA
jgi:hypothetical protein